MPVKKSFKPSNRKELQQKIRATEPGEERAVVIPQYVQEHVSNRKELPRIYTNCAQLEETGLARYEYTVERTRDVELMASKCIVFLIAGKFHVGDVMDLKAGEAHQLQDETTIQLQAYTAVVIIKQD
jgi:hypothetical protein